MLLLLQVVSGRVYVWIGRDPRYTCCRKLHPETSNNRWCRWIKCFLRHRCVRSLIARLRSLAAFNCSVFCSQSFRMFANMFFKKVKEVQHVWKAKTVYTLLCILWSFLMYIWKWMQLITAMLYRIRNLFFNTQVWRPCCSYLRVSENDKMCTGVDQLPFLHCLAEINSSTQ